jgi:hypothetical protein
MPMAEGLNDGNDTQVVPAVAGLIFAFAIPASAQTGAVPPADAWGWRFGVNLWLPTIHSSTQLDLPNGGNITSEADPGNWGDAVLAYRHLAYDLKSDRPISDIKFSGPQLSVGFKF